jgi:hypothetical protein
MGRRTRREARVKRAALGGALAAGVIGLAAGPASAEWQSVPPTPIVPFPPAGATQVDLSSGATPGDASITDGHEIDWYTFVAPRTGVHIVETDTPRSDLDTIVAVYDSGGNRLAYNDDGGFAGDPFDSWVETSLTAGMRYYFGVTNWAGHPTPGAYTWFVRASSK